jgi:hypothetical protein
MFTARKKIVKEKGAEPDDFEESVAQVRARCCYNILSLQVQASRRKSGPEQLQQARQQHRALTAAAVPAVACSINLQACWPLHAGSVRFGGHQQ